MALQALLAAALVGVATWGARRWSDRAGGLLGAFPAIAGPVLLLDALHHGGAFAARAAGGVLLGLVALAAFVAAYGRAAPRHGWPASLGLGWAAAAPAILVATRWPAGALPLAVGALACAWALLPRAPEPPAARDPRGTIALRATVTAALVVGLALAAGPLGATAGGVLAGLPVLAAVLAASTHRRRGAAATLGLLRGMLAGSASFVVFCAVVALLAGRAPVAVAFLTATAAAIVAQAAAALALGGARRGDERDGPGLRAPCDDAGRAGAGRALGGRGGSSWARPPRRRARRSRR